MGLIKKMAEGLTAIVAAASIGCSAVKVPEYLSAQPASQKTASIEQQAEEQKLLALKDESGEPLFTSAYDITRFKENGASLEDLDKISSLKEKKGKNIFSMKAAKTLCYFGIPSDYIENLVLVRNSKGNPIFTREIPILSFRQEGGTPEEAEYFAKQLEKNPDAILFLEHDIINCKRTFGSVGNLEKILAIKGSNGRNIFSEEIIFKVIKSAKPLTPEYAQALALVTDENKNPRFAVEEILFYNNLGITSDEITSALRKGENIVSFTDTSKPNALVVFPVSDWNGTFLTLTSGPQHTPLGVISDIKKFYDVQVIIAGTEQEVYKSLASTPNIDLLILGGHGKKTALLLSKEKGEKGEIDTSDNEMRDYLSHLSPNAKIILNSCSTGEGGENTDNLANFIAGMAPGREVYAPKTPSYLYKMNLEQEVSVSFMGDKCKDVTYKTSYKEEKPQAKQAASLPEVIEIDLSGRNPNPETIEVNLGTRN